MTEDTAALARKGRAAALCIAGAGLFWIAAIIAGEAYHWTPRRRALFDLIALAGFAMGLWLTFQIWRARKAETTKGAPGAQGRKTRKR